MKIIRTFYLIAILILFLIPLSGCGPTMKPFVSKGLYVEGKAGTQRFDYALETLHVMC